MEAGAHGRRASPVARIGPLARAIRDGDDELAEELLRLSRSRRYLAPLAFTVGAFAKLFEGLRLLLFNWRLVLIQIPPAMLVWAAFADLKLHVLHGASHRELRGAILIPIGLAIVTLTVACFLLNAVFAFAIAGPRPPDIRAAFASARAKPRPSLIAGAIVGAMLAVATTVAPRWGSPWFVLTLGSVAGLLVVSYVAVPARLIGVSTRASRRDKFTHSLVGGALSATVCTPPYLLGRLGILMLGSSVLRIPGVIVLAVGATLHLGATSAVSAIKMGAALVSGPQGTPAEREQGVTRAG
ncbi:MAG TPA: hypothetical protein VHY83_14920 [Solirubrobacteraceae bacterium]|nr:hypothetical protein [Solirubrobacteraceae bacterium]